MESREPFQIDVQTNQYSELINCFVQIDSLFRSSIYLQIDGKSVKFFSKITEVLDNSILFEVCESFFVKKTKFFLLLYFVFVFRQKLFAKFFFHYQQLSFSNQLFSFCYDLDLLLKFDPSQHSLSLFVSDDVFKCFSSLLNFYDIPFCRRMFSLSTLDSMIEMFYLFSLQNLIDHFVSFSVQLKDPLQFLNQDESFTSLTFEQLNSLSIKTLQEILHSDKLKNLDEIICLK
jgi:hypothetical protein